MENLVLYWRFNGIQAGKVLDASGQGHTGALSEVSDITRESLKANEPIAEEDEWGEKVQLGRALVGPAVSDELTLELFETQLTAELWVKALDSSAGSDITEVLGLGDGLSLRMRDDFSLVLVADEQTIEASHIVVPDLWTHVTLVVADRQVKLLVDGNPVLEAIPVDSSKLSGPFSLRVGSLITLTTEVRLWTVARSDEQIRDQMTVPLHRSAPASKWRGLKINIQEPANPPPIASKPLPDASNAPRKTRRVTDDPVPVEQFVTPEPPQKPETLKLPQPQLASPRVSSPVIQTEPTVPTNISPPLIESQPAPIIISDPVTGSTLPPNLIVPQAVPDAVSFFDNLLEAAISKRQNLDFNHEDLSRIVMVISSYCRSQFRLGPYLAPMPPDELLSRLRVASSYLGLANVMRSDNAWGSLPCLRLPLLKQHISELIVRCIQEGKQRNDSVSVHALSRVLMKDFGHMLDQHLIEALQRDLTFPVNTSSAVKCPFCAVPLQDPLQTDCSRGCKTRFAVCYRSGSIVPADECAKCKICCTVVSLGDSLRSHGKSVPSNLKLEIPHACWVCGCYGSLSPN